MHYPTPSLPTLIEIESLLEAQPQTAEPLKISVLRNITVEGIEPYLRYLSAAIGYRAEVAFGGYDQILQDAMSPPSGLLASDTGIVLVISSLPKLSPALDTGFAGLAAADVETELDRLEAYFKAAIRGIRARTDAPVLWHGVESPAYATLGIADDQQEGQSAAVQSLNSRLKRALAEVPAAYFVNTDRCLARLGIRQYYDLRYWQMARAPYTRAALAELAQECFKFVRALRGRNKKCLVLDCDNTLWGGIIGEDGQGGIKIGADYPGSSYLEFQKEILGLYQRGIILALCSKNNEQDVLDILDRHPDMLLKREHFSAWRINWNDKAASLREIAAELNIGVDSLIFADDSEFEINLVREFLPQVQTLQLPSERPAEYRWILAASGAFDAPSVTQEDKKRSELYRLERERNQTLAGATDLDSYYRTLGIEIQIKRADKASVARVAQQTQKTNQFNLTTRRYSEADIARMAEGEDSEVFFLRASDKFGDMGIVGSCLCQYRDDEAVIDTLLLSCRALGRGIETRFLEEVLHLLAEHGARRVYGQYIATEKNSLVADFYNNNGFAECPRRSCEGQWFSRDLAGLSERQLAHFAVVDSPLGRLALHPA